MAKIKGLKKFLVKFLTVCITHNILTLTNKPPNTN